MKILHMRWKILIPTICILVVLAVTTTIIASVAFDDYTGILFKERIEVAANGLKSYISDCEYNTWIAAVNVTSERDVVNAISERDTGEITRLLTALIRVLHVDFFVVTDESGHVLARTFQPNTIGDSIMHQENIRQALNGRVYTCMEEDSIVKVSMCTGVPVYNGDGNIIGAISAGIRFDTNDSLDRLKEHYGCEFSVIYDGARLATTIEMNGKRILGTPPAGHMIEQINQTQREVYGNSDIFGENFSLFNLPLLDETGNIFAILEAACSNTPLVKERQSMMANVTLINLLGLAIAVFVMSLITSKIVRPVNRVTRLVSEVTAGNMAVDLDIDKAKTPKDEIGLLTLDIYSFIDVIQMMLTDLSCLTADLNKFGNIEYYVDTSKYSGSYKDIIDGIKLLSDSIVTMRKTMAVMDHLDNMISVVDLDYNLLYVNSSMVNYFGMDSKTCVGQKCYKAIRGLDKPCAVCQLEKVLPGKDTDMFIDYDSLYDDAAKAYLCGRAAIIRWIDGEPVFFNSIKDDTAKIEYQEQLRIAMMDAESASFAKSAFLANMSHEIRTPMNGIIGFAELALDREIAPITRDYLSVIIENARWLLNILNDVLDISNIESGNFELEVIPFDPRNLLESCKLVIAPRAAEKKTGLRFFAEASIARTLLGDPTRLRQILLYLLSNAVKFTDGGSIKMSVTMEGETEKQQTLRFEVKDSGIGMRQEQITKIFEPFMQADISTTRKYGGTGLGMAITKHIIDQMGSKLEIESEPGLGTSISFELTFEIAQAQAAPVESQVETNTSASIEKPSFRGDVLVCEDNVMNQRVIIEHLARVGLQAELAGNGKEALDAARKRADNGKPPFDLILMDIHMPVMDGVEASRKIIDAGIDTPIVAMTANIMSEDREVYNAAGMVDYLGKPFTSQELWLCLLKFLKTADSPHAEKNTQEDTDTELIAALRIEFVRSNKDKIAELKAAMRSGDITLAHRLAHTLKGNAGLLGKSALQQTAAEVEAALKGGENKVTDTQMNVLDFELSSVLAELDPLLDELADTAISPPVILDFDADKSRELLEKLEPLLKCGNPECLDYIGELMAIPGSSELISCMEDFYFGAALKALAELKESSGW